MSYSLYDISFVPARQALSALSAIVRKGEEHANAATFLNTSLYEDMKPLDFQIISVVSLVEKLVARLTGGPLPEAGPLTLASFADANALIEKAFKLLDGADKATVNNNAETTAEIGMGPGVNIPMRLDNYATAFVMPNVYFHVMTTYTILRKEGVPLGKRDYLGSFLGPYMPKPAQ